MPRLTVFNSISLDGYFTDANSDMSWAHAGSDDPEFRAYTNSNAQGDGVMVFGRKTYDLMVSFWPTPAAAQAMPVVAQRMNSGRKIVFSKSMTEATWNNTALLKGDPAEEMRKLKAGDGGPMTLMGSGTIVAQLAQAGLVDTFIFVVCPIVLGSGRTMFEGVKDRKSLTLTDSRQFANGKIVLTYSMPS